MKKLFFLFCFSVSLITYGQILQSFQFNMFNASYQPITGSATQANPTNYAWDDEFYHMPIGFDFNFRGVDYDSIWFDTFSLLVFGVHPDTFALERNFFAANYADYTDRNYYTNDTTSISPILYRTEGTPGNRIFRIEMKNVGFYNDTIATMPNFINYQICLYEADNALEVRMGPNQILAYITPETEGLHTGAFSLNENGDVTYSYNISGNPANPFINDVLEGPDAMIDSFPDEGVVYRFVPNIVGNIAEGEFSAIKLYPNPTQNNLMITTTLSEKSNTVVKVVDINGRTLSEENYTLMPGVQNTLIPVSALPSGIYWIELKNEKNQVFRKFVKE